MGIRCHYVTYISFSLYHSYSLLLYTGIITPFRVCFYKEDPLQWIIVDSLIDCLFAIDIFVSLFSAYYDSYDNLILDRKVIMKHYIRGWFILDFTAILPLSHILNAGNYNELLRLARLPKLYRLLKISKYPKFLK
jgi:hypothetical protein